MKRETTPAKITDKIMELCSSAVPGAAPFYIPVEAAGQRLGCLAVGEYLGNAGGSCRMGKPGGEDCGYHAP